MNSKKAIPFLWQNGNLVCRFSDKLGGMLPARWADRDCLGALAYSNVGSQKFTGAGGDCASAPLGGPHFPRQLRRTRPAPWGKCAGICRQTMFLPGALWAVLISGALGSFYCAYENLLSVSGQLRQTAEQAPPPAQVGESDQYPSNHKVYHNR